MYCMQGTAANLFDRDLLQVHDKVHAVRQLIEAAQAFDVCLSWAPIAARNRLLCLQQKA